MKNIYKVSVVSGGFDPIHSGHIDYLNAAKEFGDILIVALNSDDWLVNKKGKYFMPFTERKIILENLSVVDRVIGFEDDDLGSASLALKEIKSTYPNAEIIFCNGGDRKKGHSAEENIEGIVHKFSVGGDDKKNSSSWILEEYLKKN